MNPVLRVFGICIPTYSLFSFCGLAVAYLLGINLIKQRDVKQRDFLLLSFVSALGVVVGANLLYAITRTDDIVEAFYAFGDFDSIADFSAYLFGICNGMVFYGGLYGGILVGFLWAKHKKLNLKNIGDIFAVLIPLFHTFGRIGCFFAGCCYGVKSEWGISGRVVVGDLKEGAKRVPVQLMEAALLFMLFFVLLWMFRKKVAEGKLICIYLMSYAVLRFVLEFFRGDEIRGNLFMFSTSQWISLFTLFLVLILLLHKKRRLNN